MSRELIFPHQLYYSDPGILVGEFGSAFNFLWRKIEAVLDRIFQTKRVRMHNINDERLRDHHMSRALFLIHRTGKESTFPLLL